MRPRLRPSRQATGARLIGLAGLASLLGGAALSNGAILSACAFAGARATLAASQPAAWAARALYLNETASLHLVRANESASVLFERGGGSGTFRGSVVAQLTIAPEHVYANFTIYPHGGSITGSASARYIVKGSTGYYGGTLKITHGTGSYRHAAGTNLGISGTINRYSFALTVKAHGWMKL
jgi:hypothetical protein